MVPALRPALPPPGGLHGLHPLAQPDGGSGQPLCLRALKHPGGPFCRPRRIRRLGAAEAVGSVLLLLGAGFLGGGLAGMLCAAVAAAGSLLLFLWYRRMIQKEFGGVTGDLLGYFVELSQLLLLLLLAFGGLTASAVLR